MKKTIVLNCKEANYRIAKNILKDLGIEFEELDEVATTTSSPSEKKTTKQTSSKKKSESKSKIDWAKLEPKKDDDGYYNWTSWKRCRDKYLKAVGKDYASVGKLDHKDYLKNVEPFAKKYPYVKVGDRK